MDGATFCTRCGSALQPDAQQPNQQPEYQHQYYQQSTPAQPQLPLKWFKFLVYFSLFASAVLNLINGINLIIGTQYEGNAEYMYSYYDGLQIFDAFCGLLLVAMAAFAVYTRFQLAGFRRNAPKLLLLTYAAPCIYNVIYISGTNLLMPGISMDNSTTIISSIITAAIMIFANNVYFKKRQYLFVN